MLKRLFCNNLISEIVCKRKNSILFIKIVVADNGDLSATFFFEKGICPIVIVISQYSSSSQRKSSFEG